MDILQIVLQIIFTLIVVIFGLFSGKWLCQIAPEEIVKGRKWTKLLLKVFVGLIIIVSSFIKFIGLYQSLFIVDFLIFLSAMMVGILISKEK